MPAPIRDAAAPVSGGASRRPWDAVVSVAVVATSVPLLWDAARRLPLVAVAIAAGLLVLVLVSVVSRRAEVTVVSVTAAVVTWWVLLAGVSLWPAPLVTAAVVASLVGRRIFGASATSWLRWGHVDRVVIALSVMTVMATGAVLYGWAVWTTPDGGPYLTTLRSEPLAVALLGVLAFSLVNSACEEAVYRGVFQHALTVRFGVIAAIVAQAAAFGVLHSSGFPSGLGGIALAAIYGGFLGVLRHRSGGLAVPYVVHVFADIIIGLVVVTVL